MNNVGFLCNTKLKTTVTTLSLSSGSHNRLKALENEVGSLQGQLQAVRAEVDQKQAVVVHLSEVRRETHEI